MVNIYAIRFLKGGLGGFRVCFWSKTGWKTKNALKCSRTHPESPPCGGHPKKPEKLLPAVPRARLGLLPEVIPKARTRR